MSKPKSIFYKITGYVVICNLSYDAVQRMKNRSKPGPSLKIYDRAAFTGMTDTTLADKTHEEKTDIYG